MTEMIEETIEDMETRITEVEIEIEIMEMGIETITGTSRIIDLVEINKEVVGIGKTEETSIATTTTMMEDSGEEEEISETIMTTMAVVGSEGEGILETITEMIEEEEGGVAEEVEAEADSTTSDQTAITMVEISTETTTQMTTDKMIISATANQNVMPLTNIDCAYFRVI